MESRTVVLKAENGLHTRPAAEFVKLAKSFDCEIIASNDGKSANAKSLFKLQLLGLSRGSALTVEASGPDEARAADALAAFLQEHC